MDWAIKAAMLLAWRVALVRRSESICSLMRYVPEGMGRSTPPRAMIKSRVDKSIPACSRASSTARLRKSSWSRMSAKGASCSGVWPIFFSNDRVRSSNTPILVEVEPGLITRLLYFFKVSVDKTVFLFLLRIFLSLPPYPGLFFIRVLPATSLVQLPSPSRGQRSEPATARAIEASLASIVSAREVSTMGAAAPRMTAPMRHSVKKAKDL